MNKAILFFTVLSLVFVNTIILNAGKNDNFSLIKNRKSTAVVVLPGNAGKKLLEDVDFFNSELHKCAGAKLPVMKKISANGNQIKFELKKCPFIDKDQYSITFPDRRTLLISGTEVSFRWALNHILDKAGVRYPYPGVDGAHYPRLNDFSLPRKTVKSTASYKLFRGLFAGNHNWELALNCSGGDSTRILNHAVDAIFPLAKYSKGEWIEKIMPIRNGQRDTAAKKFYWEPCYSNPATATEAIKNICAYFEKYPDRHFYSLTINDGCNLECQCATCRKLNQQFNTSILRSGRHNYSGSYYTWVNKVASGVTKKFPNKYFGVLAYAGVRNPPSFKLHPNVVVSICFESYACVDPEVFRHWKKIIMAWKKRASRLGMWEYGYGIICFTLPRVYFSQQAAVLRYMCQQGGEIGFVENMPSFGEGPKRYLYLKLFDNVNIDLDKTLKGWYEAAVGKAAAPYLQKYYAFWEKFWTERATKTSWFQSTKFNTYTGMMPDGGYIYALNKGDIARCRELMEKVVRLANAHGDERQKIRAKQQMLEFEFYEASAYSCAAEIVPVSGSLINHSQALELALAMPKIIKHTLKRAELARQILSSSPEWWGGIYRKFYPETFRKRFCSPKFPEALSLLSGYLDNKEVRAAVFKSLKDKAMPPAWKNFIIMLADISSGKAKTLLADGSFEKGNDNWTVCGKPSADKAASGKQSLKITFAKDGKFEMVKRTPMKAGKQYYLSARILIPADYPPGVVYGNGYILGINTKKVGSNYYIPAKTEIIPGKWTTISTIANPGKCAGHGDIYVIIEGMKKSENAYVDDVMFCEIQSAAQAPKAKRMPVRKSSFAGWTLADVGQRKSIGKHIKTAGQAVTVTAYEKNALFFNTQPLSAANGKQLELSFKAEGSGQGIVGFFAYKNQGWAGASGTIFRNFTPTANSAEYKFKLPVKGAAIKSIRIVIGVKPNSSIKFSNLKTTVK